MARDYYTILGVGRNATPEEIKEAFRRLAHQYHPDKKGGDAQKFKEINEAYQVLSDTDKRAQYDQYGQTFEQAQAQGGFGGFEGFRDFSNYAQATGVNFEDLSEMLGGFGDLFGMGTGRGRRTGRGRGRDLETTVQISFRDMVLGASVDLPLDRTRGCESCKGTGAQGGAALKTCTECKGAGERTQTRRTIFGAFQTVGTCEGCDGRGKIVETPCATCRGKGIVSKRETLTVTIPPGIDDRATLRLRGQGEAAAGGGSGDLYVHVRVESSREFQRLGDSADLFTTLPLTIVEAALGTQKDIRTIDGTIELTVPSGIQNGERLRVLGKGIIKDGRGGRGDLYVGVSVTTPRHLSRKARKLLEELAQEL